MQWKENEFNQTLHSQDNKFYITYNEDCNKFIIKEFRGDTGVETALVRRQHNSPVFYILNGDHRKQYEKLIDKGFKACYAYFKSQKKLKSSWSH
jgi:hypothetical protein